MSGVERRLPEDIRIPELVEELARAMDTPPIDMVVVLPPEVYDRWCSQVGKRPGRGVKATIGIVWRTVSYKLPVVCREDAAPGMVVVMPREDLRR